MQKEAHRPFSSGVVGQSNVAERAESRAVFEKRKSNVVSFAEMGLNTDEIKLALVIAAREDISYDEINSILTTAITRGILPKKEHSGKFNVSLTGEEQVNKVFKLVIAREMIDSAETVTKPQGKNEWERVVESMGDIDKPLDIVKKLLRRGVSLSDAIQIAKLEYTPTEDPIVRFAQELAADDGIIPNRRSEFDQLILICSENKIRLPHISYYIVLEAFLNARKGIKTKPQDLNLLNRYQELRDMFFNEETIEPKLDDLEDRIGEIDDNIVYRADEVGFYRLGDNGRRYRVPIGFDDNGIIIVDSPILNIQRCQSRDRIRAARLEGKSTIAEKSAILWDMNHPLDVKH